VPTSERGSTYKAIYYLCSHNFKCYFEVVTNTLSSEAIGVLRDLNPWWVTGRVQPVPPPFIRPAIADLAGRIQAPRSLIEVVRGPRQVGKTTGIAQIISTLLNRGIAPSDIVFVRFDLEILRDEPASLRRIADWFVREIRRRQLADGAPAFLFLDEVHKLRHWSDEVKHLGDTFPVRILLTGSSSVLVARGGRESLAGRVFNTDLPAFSFREVLECWKPELAAKLPPRVRFQDAFEGALKEWASAFDQLKAQQKLAVRRALEKYYVRGGYPRLHSGEVDEDRWADYVVQTIFENVLGADIPDLFPVEQPRLLRALYLEVAKHTGQELAQNKLTQWMNNSGYKTNQPTVGKYMHYLADALLIREFRRYPMAKKASSRVPAKITLTDLGVRNAILRSSPSLWESDPATLGPLVETLVQSCIRDHNLQVHFFRDYEDPGNRRSPVREVDFVAERTDGLALPIEVKFRRKIEDADLFGLALFCHRFTAAPPIVVTRDTFTYDVKVKRLLLPLESFLLAF
jgi:predicted AAA+ superfamily ATPase